MPDMERFFSAIMNCMCVGYDESFVSTKLVEVLASKIFPIYNFNSYSYVLSRTGFNGERRQVIETLEDAFCKRRFERVSIEYSPVESFEEINRRCWYTYDCTDFYFSYQIAIKLIADDSIEDYVEFMAFNEHDADDLRDFMYSYFAGSDGLFDCLVEWCHDADSVGDEKKWLMDILYGVSLIINFITGSSIELPVTAGQKAMYQEFMCRYGDTHELQCVNMEHTFRDLFDERVESRIMLRVRFREELKEHDKRMLFELMESILGDGRLSNNLTDCYKDAECHYLMAAGKDLVILGDDMRFEEYAPVLYLLTLLIAEANANDCVLFKVS